MVQVDPAALSRQELEAEVLRLGERAGQAESYRALFDAIDDGLCIIEFFDGPQGPLSDYVHVEANAGYERHTGIPDIVGKTLRQIAPLEAEGWLELYGGVLRTGASIRFERDFVAVGRWIEVSAARVEPPSRRQVSVLFRDISERKRAEAIARENIQRVQLALSAGAIIGTWNWDLRSDRFTVDEAFATAFGLDPALGREGISLEQVVATVHPEDKPALAEAINEAIGRGGAYAHQYRVRRHDGRYYWIEANGRVDHDADGTPLTFPGVLLDIEKRRSLEGERDRAAAALRALTETLEQQVADRTAELMQAEEQLRQAQKMEAVGQLTGGVAHDFNNLLTVIRGSVDLLRRPSLSEERRARYVEAIAHTADRAAKLTGQLLAFSRRQALQPEVFDVRSNLSGLEDMLRTLVGTQARLTLKTPEEACFINADPVQFDTAVVNMAANARDAMEAGGALTLSVGTAQEVPPVRAHPAAPGQFVTLSVTDTGSGIAAADLERIFEPFFTTKEVGAGTGLGLSQVYGFVKQSGGEVMVASEIGRGTTFTLFLPRVAPPAGMAETPQAETHGMDLKGVRMLVVEDNPEVGRFATSTLVEMGVAVVHAETGEAALEELESDASRFDLVFSDVVMPGMNGIDLAHLVRRHHPAMPIVLTSGYSHVLAQHGSSGFDLLHKPYSTKELVQALTRALHLQQRPGSAGDGD